MSLKKALLHIYGVRSIYNIVNVCKIVWFFQGSSKVYKIINQNKFEGCFRFLRSCFISGRQMYCRFKSRFKHCLSLRDAYPDVHACQRKFIWWRSSFYANGRCNVQFNRCSQNKFHVGVVFTFENWWWFWRQIVPAARGRSWHQHWWSPGTIWNFLMISSLRGIFWPRATRMYICWLDRCLVPRKYKNPM